MSGPLGMIKLLATGVVIPLFQGFGFDTGHHYYANAQWCTAYSISC